MEPLAKFSLQKSFWEASLNLEELEREEEGDVGEEEDGKRWGRADEERGGRRRRWQEEEEEEDGEGRKGRAIGGVEGGRR